MVTLFDRRKFIKTTAITGIGLGISGSVLPLVGRRAIIKGKRIGIIGLDTSHSVEFTKELNAVNASSEFGGYHVVAAYPKGSIDIQSSVKRIPGYIEQVKKMGVEIVDSIPSLLEKVDIIMLETNDGRTHLEQAMLVFKAGKIMWIDKPVTASLADTMVMFNAAKHYKVPVFSSSNSRFRPSTRMAISGKIGKIVGADTYSPCVLEKTHPDFFWYGIHGVELLHTVMGTGCKNVVRIHTDQTDVAVGTWGDGRIGVFRGTRSGKHDTGGTAFGEKGNSIMDSDGGGYDTLLKEIINFFQTTHSPVQAEETLAIYAFMEAADESKRRNGDAVSIDEVWNQASKVAEKKLNDLIS